MHIRTSLALRALRGARWAPAVACGAVTAPVALAVGGTGAAVPAVATVTLATALAAALAGGARRASSGLGGIARAWARAHPWRFAAGPALGLTATLLALDAVTGLPSGGAALAGLAVLAAPRLGTLRPLRTAGPVRAAAPLAGRRLVRALPAPAPAPAPSAPPPQVAALS